MAYTQLPNGLLDLSNPASTLEVMKQNVIEQPANLLSVTPRSLNLPTTGGNTAPMSDAAFGAQMANGEANAVSLGTTGEAIGKAVMAMLTSPPIAVQVMQALLGPNGLGIGIGTSPGAPGTGVGMGGTAASGMSGMGMSAGAPSGQSASNSGSGEGGMNAGGGGRGGDGGSSSGDGGGASGGDGGGSSGGGGGGGGGGCCFIMLEARYGDGTMDRVVRRYRDEKITDRNKRGYYKLAEVFIPLMRKSKLFSFFVVKTFADPAVCYAKWYYGENKWGWIFKPLERFWMKLFDTLGTETKFIRENGEMV